MLIIPAIDLRGGKVVRLFQGRFDRQKVYSLDPVKAARHWARQGAKFLHVVDLDGASGGKSGNLAALKRILENIQIPLEFGGGVRNIKAISALLALGVQRVVLGTRAAEDRKFLDKAHKEFGGRVIVSIDAREGKVLTKGWNSSSAKNALDFAGELKDLGFKQVIYTDVSRDGALCGPNIAGVKELIRKTGLDVIASGGVSGLGDLKKLKALRKGLSGVIVGKALYEGKFTLAEALSLK